MSTGINFSTITVLLELHEWVFMAEQLHASLTSSSTMKSVGWSGVKHTDTGLWSSRNLFYDGHSLMGESGFGRCQENIACLNVLCRLKSLVE